MTLDRLFARSRIFAASRRFAHDREGAAAIEFAIVALPFFMLLFAVMEIGFMFYVNTMIDNATAEAARKIRTGEIQMAGASADDFWDEVCDNVQIVAACDGRLFVDVRTFDSFAGTRQDDPVTNGDFDPSGLQSDFGESGDIVLVRVYYVWDVFFPSLGTGLSNLNGGKRLLSSTAAFRNEPFGELGAG